MFGDGVSADERDVAVLDHEQLESKGEAAIGAEAGDGDGSVVMDLPTIKRMIAECELMVLPPCGMPADEKQLGQADRTSFPSRVMDQHYSIIRTASQPGLSAELRQATYSVGDLYTWCKLKVDPQLSAITCPLMLGGLYGHVASCNGEQLARRPKDHGPAKYAEWLSSCRTTDDMLEHPELGVHLAYGMNLAIHSGVQQQLSKVAPSDGQAWGHRIVAMRAQPPTQQQHLQANAADDCDQVQQHPALEEEVMTS